MPTEPIADLIVGVVSNALWSTFEAFTAAKPARHDSDASPSDILDDEALQELRRDVGRAVTDAGDIPLSGLIHNFLEARDFHNFVVQAISFRLAGAGASALEALYAEYELLVDLFSSSTIDAYQKHYVYGLVLQAVDTAVRRAHQQGRTTGQDLLSDARTRVIQTQLAAIERNTRLLTTHAEHAPDYEAFENDLRRQIAERHRLITPPNVDTAKRVSIDSQYVAPTIIAYNDDADDLRISYKQLAARIRRTVVLGDPGGGKSTLCAKLCRDLNRDPNRGPKPRQASAVEIPRTAFLVVLREFGAQKKADHCSIVRFIEGVCASRYQVEAPPGAVEFLLLNGRLLVVFDGLDELLDTSFRQEVTGDVESFAHRYPNAPILVTSRLIGYSEAPLDQNEFSEFKVGAFSSDQVEEYAVKWFRLDSALTASERAEKASAFIRESFTAEDLRSNPLMLALMCNIYRGENYIPTNRPDLYEKCATMMFERWDRQREIFPSVSVESHIRPAMMYLAYHTYADPTSSSVVTETDLVRLSTEYMSARVFDDDPDQSARVAQQLVDFCTGRAWVFTDVGTTGSGEKLYQFTHRTFLEYFTAHHLIRLNPTPRKLLSALRKRIIRAEWNVVAQLALQLQNRMVEGAADEFLTSLLRYSQRLKGDKFRVNASEFAVSCLKFLVPQASTTRAIVDRALAEVLSAIDGTLKEGHVVKFISTSGPVSSILANLVGRWDENGAAVDTTLEGSLALEVELGRRAAMELVLCLPEAVGFLGIPRADDPERYPARAIFRKIVSDKRPHMVRACSDSASALAGCLNLGIVSLKEFLEMIGPSGLFAFDRRPFFYWIEPVIWNLTYALLSENSGDGSAWRSELRWNDASVYLGECYELLLAAPRPWGSLDVELMDVVTSSSLMSTLRARLRHDRGSKEGTWSASSRKARSVFAILVSAALEVESIAVRSRSRRETQARLVDLTVGDVTDETSSYLAPWAAGQSNFISP